MNIENDDPVAVAADNAEDLLDALLDNLRAQIAARSPVATETLIDQVMDHVESLRRVQRDRQWMPLMTAVLAAVAIQRLAYREEALTPTEDQCRVLSAIADAANGVDVASFSTPDLAATLDMTCEEVCRHSRALARLGLIEQI